MYVKIMVKGGPFTVTSDFLWPLTPVDTGQCGSPTGTMALSSTDIM